MATVLSLRHPQWLPHHEGRTRADRECPPTAATTRTTGWLAARLDDRRSEKVDGGSESPTKGGPAARNPLGHILANGKTFLEAVWKLEDEAVRLCHFPNVDLSETSIIYQRHVRLYSSERPASAVPGSRKNNSHSFCSFVGAEDRQRQLLFEVQGGASSLHMIHQILRPRRRL